MNFHLNFNIPSYKSQIKYSDKIVFIGSCFAENIGDLIKNAKFSTIINPFGITYNPISICNSISRIIENKKLIESDLLYSNELWYNWEIHSRFSDTDKENYLLKINSTISNTHNFLKDAKWLFITMGSAFVYQLNQTGEIVNNCHKIPQKEFNKKLIKSDEIVKHYEILINQLKKFNSNLNIVFTVSPVRYIRDGVTENTISKAQLINSIYELKQLYENVFYFPAYELIIDDLRDYRFYKKDLLHPNEMATEYVFEKLIEAIFDDSSKEIYLRIKKIMAAKNHKPFNTGTESYKLFKATHLKMCNELVMDYPHINLKEEIALFSSP